jgi:hypothetical protein
VASEAEIASFLHKFKQIVVSGRGLDLIPRAENNQTLLNLGLTRRNVRNEILALSVLDYCRGPDPDRDRPGEVWIFGRTVFGSEIYIKLKIATVSNTEIAKCISFHEANYPLNFPLR